MEEGFQIWANPSSPHAEGRKARAALEDARERVKRALGWEGELIFTSGASEALWIALNRAKAKRRIVSAVEHDAVFRAAPDAEVVPPFDGMFDPDELPDCSSALVALQHVNSETGTIMQPHRGGTLTATIRAAGSVLLVDASQSAGKLPLPGADMVVVSAHKFGGPVGIGALWCVISICWIQVEVMSAATGKAPRTCPALWAWRRRLRQAGWKVGGAKEATTAFADALGRSAQVIAPGAQADHIFAIAHPTMSAQALLIRLDAMGFAVSAGSACSSGTLKKSRVLDAFGVPDDVAARTIRVSLGWSTTPEELERFSEAWAGLA